MKRFKQFCLIFLLCLVQPSSKPKRPTLREVHIVNLDFNQTFSNYLAVEPQFITVSPYIFRNNKFKYNSTDIAHEMVHIEQQNREGGAFYPKYAFYWATGFVYYMIKYRHEKNLIWKAKGLAYFLNPYEFEAYCTTEGWVLMCRNPQKFEQKYILLD